MNLLLRDDDAFEYIKTRKDEEVLAFSVKDPNAFKIIVERYEKAFLRKARSIIGYREDAYDIVQETFTKIYLNAHRFKTVEGASFKSWGYKILINVTFTWYAKLKKERDNVFRLDPELDDILEDPKSMGILEKEGIRDYVVSILASMPDNFSEALRKFFIEEKSQKEIADEEGISVEAIKTRIHRAKKEFMKKSLELNPVE